MVLELGSWVIMFFAVLFLLYLNSVLRKSRTKDLALYSMLGVSKKNISVIIALETFFTAIMSLLLAIGTFTMTYPLLIQIIAKILDIEKEITLELKPFLIFKTLRFFLIIHLILGVINIVNIRKLNPLKLMIKSKEGEKEPKASIIGIIIGIALLFFGYFQALTTNSIFKSMEIFLIAVIAVIFGTYFLFGSISIIVIKALKKNKKIYYKEKNMTFISSILFRIRESSAALASICIISTMFLVVFISLTGLLKSRDTFLEYAFPSDYQITFKGWDEDVSKKIEKRVLEISKEDNQEIKDIKNVKQIIALADYKNGELKPVLHLNNLKASTVFLYLVDLEQFNEISKEKISLKDDEVLIHTNMKEELKNIKMGDLKYKVINLESSPRYISDPSMGLFENLVIITKDTKKFTDEIDKFIGDRKDTEIYTMETNVFIDLVNNKNIDDKFENDIVGSVFSQGFISEKYPSSFISGVSSRIEFNNMYSGLYIVCVLLSVVFLISTSIIIYYKQISEGISDGENIAIMKKIGMSSRQIRKQVGRQNSFMFFAPFFVAICHTLGSSKIVFDIVKIVGIMDRRTFMKSSVIGVGIYFIVYFVMFKLSTRVYLKMAKRYENI